MNVPIPDMINIQGVLFSGGSPSPSPWHPFPVYQLARVSAAGSQVDDLMKQNLTISGTNIQKVAFRPILRIFATPALSSFPQLPFELLFSVPGSAPQPAMHVVAPYGVQEFIPSGQTTRIYISAPEISQDIKQYLSSVVNPEAIVYFGCLVTSVDTEVTPPSPVGNFRLTP